MGHDAEASRLRGKVFAAPRRPDKPIAVTTRMVAHGGQCVSGETHVAISMPALSFLRPEPPTMTTGRPGRARETQYSIDEGVDILLTAARRGRAGRG